VLKHLKQSGLFRWWKWRRAWYMALECKVILTVKKN